jgi:hypothetical protein
MDTEFSGLQQNAELLALALIAPGDRWFYAVFTEVELTKLSAWHQENVVPHLYLSEQQLASLRSGGEYVIGSREEIVDALRRWLAQFEAIEMWADVPAYDWVLFCELFGGAFGLPKQVHYVVRDLATLLEAKGYDIDTDRFAMAYGKNMDANTAVVISSSDGRIGGDQAPAKTAEGLLRHNALGDAFAGLACYEKLMKNQAR